MAAAVQPDLPASVSRSSSSKTLTFADSPFLASPNSSSKILPNSRVIAHLTRDILSPVLVLPAQSSDASTPEPVANLKRKAPSSSTAALNTRFGSFPHSSLLVEPGSQVRSSSGSGFIHILRPTPELWTASLPHRTQVVYTPDSSYILHRLRARPGSRLIEAGAGSGSFTHASARAVYNGVYDKSAQNTEKSEEQKENGDVNGVVDGAVTENHDYSEAVGSRGETRSGDGQGRVFSFEFHEDRTSILRHELRQHGLHDIVTITHRDVCALGFSLPDPKLDIGGNTFATAVFLDLPAPWLAIPHLNRENGSLSREKAVRICCFSPCLEQALRTIVVLRESDWTEEELVEVAHKRLEVRRIGVTGREIGSKFRAGDDEPKVASVTDAVEKLKSQLWRRKEKQARQRERIAKRRKLESGEAGPANDADDADDMDIDLEVVDDEEDEEAANEEQGNSKLHLFKQGRVTVRTEPELKTHTSYLVFAVLPLPWTLEDEERTKKRYPIPPRPAPQVNPATGRDYTSGMKGPKPRPDGKLSKRQEKKLKRAVEFAAKQMEGSKADLPNDKISDS